jgi:hypothetical protein
MASAAWTRKEGKSKSGGLNAKGVASYRAANPGSKLKTAVTTKPSKLKAGSKDAKRRASFCARMTGMRKDKKLVIILVKIDYLNHLENGIVNERY